MVFFNNKSNHYSSLSVSNSLDPLWLYPSIHHEKWSDKMISGDQRDRRLFGLVVVSLFLMAISFVIAAGLSIIPNSNLYDYAIYFGTVMFAIVVFVSLAYLIALVVKYIVFYIWVFYIWALMMVTGEPLPQKRHI